MGAGAGQNRRCPEPRARSADARVVQEALCPRGRDQAGSAAGARRRPRDCAGQFKPPFPPQSPGAAFGGVEKVMTENNPGLGSVWLEI